VRRLRARTGPWNQDESVEGNFFAGALVSSEAFGMLSEPFACILNFGELACEARNLERIERLIVAVWLVRRVVRYVPRGSSGSLTKSGQRANNSLAFLIQASRQAVTLLCVECHEACSPVPIVPNVLADYAGGAFGKSTPVRAQGMMSSRSNGIDSPVRSSRPKRSGV
jgi:hypothetical protein